MVFVFWPLLLTLIIVLIFSTDCKYEQDKEKTQLAYIQADYSAMREFVKRRLSYVDLSDKSDSTVWSHLNEVMQEAIKRFVPHRPITNKSKKP